MLFIQFICPVHIYILYSLYVFSIHAAIHYTFVCQNSLRTCCMCLFWATDIRDCKDGVIAIGDAIVLFLLVLMNNLSLYIEMFPMCMSLFFLSIWPCLFFFCLSMFLFVFLVFFLVSCFCFCFYFYVYLFFICLFSQFVGLFNFFLFVVFVFPIYLSVFYCLFFFLVSIFFLFTCLSFLCICFFFHLVTVDLFPVSSYPLYPSLSLSIAQFPSLSSPSTISFPLYLIISLSSSHSHSILSPAPSLPFSFSNSLSHSPPISSLSMSLLMPPVLLSLRPSGTIEVPADAIMGGGGTLSYAHGLRRRYFT